MNPAPGYDDRMPHDLLHFVVERELGLRHGIFGQIAAGGTAGTFHAVLTSGERPRDASRRQRDLARRGAKLLRQGHHDAVRSERVAHICHDEWLARAAHRDRTSGTLRRPNEPIQLLKGSESANADVVTGDQLDRICEQLDEISSVWIGLDVGQSLTVVWPE